MERPPVLALPTEPLRGLAYHPTVPLCAFTYWLWLALAVRHTEQARYGCRIFRDALPGPEHGVEPHTPLLVLPLLNVHSTSYVHSYLFRRVAGLFPAVTNSRVMDLWRSYFLHIF